MPDPASLVGDGALPPRARFTTDAPVLSLNGSWRFLLSPSLADAPAGVGDPGFDDGAWGSIEVPSSWPMAGHGAPAYTNTVFPFPVDPPHPPDENPVGDFRRRFEWSGGPAVLRLDGVDNAGEVWLNGTRLGSTRGSRLVHEFDASGALVAGENLLVLRVTQWSATSYLEDQDMWWLPGVFRDVTLQAAPAGGIVDVVVRAGWAEGAGVLRVDAVTRDGATATVAVPSLGVEGLAVGAEHRIDGVRPWTAETPELLDVVVRTPGETATLRVGFRTITIEDAQLKVNGQRIRFRGVNRHEHHPDLGRVIPPELVRSELLLMKQHNVNAIRTSHYPPHPDLPGLADELGFYLIDECDLETHGFIHVGWRGNPSDDPAWEPAYLDRMRRTIARDRNHPSVILWSLGNEAGTGRNLEASARLAHELDPSRPVHYEGDWSSTYVDVYSRMYAHQDEVDAIGRQAEEPLPDAGADAHRRALPFLQCEYIHAMGNGPGGIDEYEASFRRHPRTQGGFVWEWLEHGIRRTTPEGRTWFAYGGDFGEPLHDGNFVADGLVDADRNPRPGLADVKKAYEPVYLEVTDDRSALRIRNAFDFRGLDGLTLVWSVEGGASGTIPLPEVAPHATAEVALPAEAGGDGVLTVRLVTAAPTGWADAGHEVAWTQAGALPVAAAPAARVAPRRDGRRLTLGPAVLDGVTGRLVTIGDVPVPGPDLTLWRAPTDNDRGVAKEREGLPSDADGWQREGLHRLRRRVLSVTATDDAVEVVTRVGPAATDAHVVVTERWTSDGQEIGLEVTVLPHGEWPFGWARVGLEFVLPFRPEGIAWDGYGPGQRYPDTGGSQRLGHWRVGEVLDLHTEYVRPQENGSRAGCTRLDVGTPGAGFTVTGDGFSFTASPWTSAELAAAAHPIDLPDAAGRCRLVIDLAEHGIGTAACGPGVLPAYRLDARSVTGRLALRPM
ncbi:MAG TPA: glycoside hydrolase family 2 TIM barrel-domain containing protein [Amnibacterium sp.]|nr:glycoside hydrolase family 2 TIM barrel-domain containing protein [Amnibacterium sp.]